jgi:2-C-methyl-D-erythritol 2,4-cyclodiphosphate synthase
VLSHCICDALLGAGGLGDIGTHFPNTDPKWKAASSLLFLEHTRDLLAARGLSILHVDAIVVTEKPKLGPHFPAMRAALARALGIAPKQINLKAKTNEGVDAIGRGEALAAYAVASIGEAIKPTANARERIRHVEKKARRTLRSSSRPRKRP